MKDKSTECKHYTLKRKENGNYICPTCMLTFSIIEALFE